MERWELLRRAFVRGDLPWQPFAVLLAMVAVVALTMLVLWRPETASRLRLILTFVAMSVLVVIGLAFLAIVFTAFGANAGVALCGGSSLAGAYGLALACMRAPIPWYAKNARQVAVFCGVVLMLLATLLILERPEAPAYAFAALVPLSLLWAWRRARREDQRRAAEAQGPAEQAEPQEPADGKP